MIKKTLEEGYYIFERNDGRLVSGIVWGGIARGWDGNGDPQQYSIIRYWKQETVKELLQTKQENSDGADKRQSADEL